MPRDHHPPIHNSCKYLAEPASAAGSATGAQCPPEMKPIRALDPDLTFSEAADITYVALSPEVHRVLTVERGRTADQYEQWLVRSLGALLRR